MQRQRCLFDFYISSVMQRVKQAGQRWKQCVSILKRNVNSMGKTHKYEGGWTFTETRGLKAESSQQHQDVDTLSKTELVNGAAASGKHERK